MDAATLSQLSAQIIALLALLISLVTTRWNLSAAKDSAAAQLKSQKDIKLTEIKADLLAKSRQAWISDFRRMTADYLILCDPDNQKAGHAERQQRELDITTATLKLELYLDPRDPDHSKFKNSVITLSLACSQHARPDDRPRLELSADVIERAKIILKKEMKWLEEQFDPQA